MSTTSRAGGGLPAALRDFEFDEALSSVEVSDDVLPLLRDLIAPIRPLIPAGPCVDFPDETLGDHRFECPLQEHPIEVRAVHDAGRLPHPILDYPQNIQVDL